MDVAIRKNKTDRLVARVSREDKALMERAALLEGCSVAAFVVAQVRTAAQNVVREHETLRLTQVESENFIQAILAPPRPPSKRMQEALELYRDSVIER